MEHTEYLQRRQQIETYFDRTAAQAWARLTSNAPVGRIRRTVRAGRDQMRSTLLSWMPDDLSGLRVLDAGSGTGALAMEAAQRGADVVAIDLSPTLVDLARERWADTLKAPGAGRIWFSPGDMLDESFGEFDHIVAMDSLIHYDTPDIVAALQRLAPRARRSIAFTFAPRTPLLAAMHRVGRLFPRGDRSPSLTPVAQVALRAQLGPVLASHGFASARERRVASGFYTSHAWEWSR
jgi:magnesium-protoporphyrin O-methyltransferase